MGAICQRCGEEGEDRRTLYMACLYAMEELDIPFSTWKMPDPWKRKFYTLTVCKECRAQWMQAIQSWFNQPKPTEKPNSGYFVRELGVSVEKPLPKGATNVDQTDKN